MVCASGNHFADLARGQGVLKLLEILKTFKVAKEFELSIDISYIIVTDNEDYFNKEIERQKKSKDKYYPDIKNFLMPVTLGLVESNSEIEKYLLARV